MEPSLCCLQPLGGGYELSVEFWHSSKSDDAGGPVGQDTGLPAGHPEVAHRDSVLFGDRVGWGALRNRRPFTASKSNRARLGLVLRLPPQPPPSVLSCAWRWNACWKAKAATADGGLIRNHHPPFDTAIRLLALKGAPD